MKKAVQYLVGTHDFRNFCKADVQQVRWCSLRALKAAGCTVADFNLFGPWLSLGYGMEPVQRRSDICSELAVPLVLL